MNLSDELRLADSSPAFLRHLHRRVEVIGRRLHRFLSEGWDINGLAMLREDAAQLSGACADKQLQPASDLLTAIADLLAEPLQAQALPEPALGERLWHLIEDLGSALPSAPEAVATPSLGRVQGLVGRAEVPPAHYWRRWGDDAPPVTRTDEVATPVAPPTPAPAKPDLLSPPPLAAARDDAPAIEKIPMQPRTAPTRGPEAQAAQMRSAPAKPAPTLIPAHAAVAATPVPGAMLRVYHLSDHGPLSLELDQRMEALGYEVELLDNAEELLELLGALPANLALVDAAFSAGLEAIGEAVRQARQRSSQKVLLAALATADDIALRLSARRAGVDALIIEPGDASQVLKRLQQLFDPSHDTPYRVLVVEDDRSQALFAEGVLRNAGMETRVVLEALEVMPVLEQFQPDLILMDLHMPGANGIELTSLIREHASFLHTPIVFLSGESDQDQQFDALDAGGDDFLAKPIRPRHLIASVQNRVRRHRALEERRQKPVGRDRDTGLFDRAELLERVEHRLIHADDHSLGGLIFLEIDSLSQLRERLGLSTLEILLADVSRLLCDRAGALCAARFGDGSFLVLDTERDDAGLDSLAGQLRGGLVQQPFEAQGHPLRIRVSAGYAAFRHHFADVGSLLNAIERTARDARTVDRGIKRFEPTRQTEAAREAAMLTQVRDAVANKRLELLYQPVVAVAGSDDSQYQVLLRLRDSDGKLLPAAQVVPLAERGDFILDIDRWVLLQALALIRQRRAEGRQLRLFVTQSPLTLSDSSQAAWLKTELVAHDVPGTSLVMELRLDDVAVHAATIRQFCESMVADGLQFCLSQFESGSEPESLLDQLPLGFVKLARKYTSGAMSPALRDELKVLIARAHRRGLEVIGHGVEDAQAAATLWMSGIDFIQGNLVQQAEQDLEFDFQQAVL